MSTAIIPALTALTARRFASPAAARDALLETAAAHLGMRTAFVTRVSPEAAAHTLVAIVDHPGGSGIRALTDVPLLDAWCRAIADAVPPAPRVIGDVHRDHAGAAPGVGSFVGVPILLSDGACDGTLCVVDPAPRALARPQVDLLVLLAGLLAAWQERDRATSALREMRDELDARVWERADRLVTLSEIGRELSAELDLDRFLASAWHHVTGVLGVRDCWLGLWDPVAEAMDYSLYVLDGVRRPDAEKRLPLGEGKGLAGEVVTGRETIRVPDYLIECVRRGMAPSGPSTSWASMAWLGVPLAVGGRIIGAMAVWRYDRPFDAEDQATLETLAGQMAAALDNARLHTAVQRELAERVRAEEALRESQRFAQRIADATPDFLYVYDLVTGQMPYVNRGATHALGYPVEDLLVQGVNFFRSLLHPDDGARMSAHLAGLAAVGDAEIVEVEYRLRDVRGDWHWLRSRETVFARGANGVPTQILGTARDITAHKELEGRLAHRASHDPLTGLANRTRFSEELTRALARNAETGARCGILFLDLDGPRQERALDSLKAVNNGLGHDAGDQLLVAVAGRLRACLRPHDVAARLGGDEFVLLLVDLPGAAEAVRVAERVLARLAVPFAIAGRTVSLSASIGIALSTPDHDSADALLRAADRAMYHAKERGKACYALDRDD